MDAPSITATADHDAAWNGTRKTAHAIKMKIDQSSVGKLHGPTPYDFAACDENVLRFLPLLDFLALAGGTKMYILRGIAY